MKNVALPFVAGVAVCAILTGGRPSHAIAGLSLAAASCVLAALCRSGKGFWIHPLFLLLGGFCYGTALLETDLGRDGALWRLAEAASSELKGVIDSIPFSGNTAPTLIRALLTGDRSGLPREIVGAFRESGASHLLALSGLHLGFIYGLVRKLSAVAGNWPSVRRLRSAAIIAFCAFYTIMTGAADSTVRAFLFICLKECGNVLDGRGCSGADALMAAGTVQLALSPLSIRETGFQMSYLAVCGIIFLSPRFEGWFPKGEGRINPMRRIWRSATMSLSCQAFTAPLAWATFHTFPKYFLLTNLLALPLASGVMFMAVVAIALTGAGICPQWLVWATEQGVAALTGTLEVIAGM